MAATKKLARTGNSFALVLDRPLLEAAHIDADTPLEVSTDGRVIVLSPVRDSKRAAKLKSILRDAYERYGGVFRKLAD